MDIKIGAAYVRVSTTDQMEYSPDSQIKLIRDFAKRDGYIIPDEYVYQDDGISGKSADKRPAFRLMIATAKEDNPPFDCIFVWKYSRFARNQEEAIMYKNLLRKKNIEVKSISEPSNDSPFASLIERIIEWMDEYYLINLSSEVKRGMKEKSMRGEAMGKAPFGYTAKDKILVPNEYANTVRYIYELCASGVSFREIASILKEQGVKTPRGKNPDSYSIRYILRNPAYIGKTRWAEGEHYGYRTAKYQPNIEELPEGKHEPIISMELWNAAQEKLAGRDTSVKYVRRDKPVIYPLKGLIRCGNCGATLSRVMSHNGRNINLQCYRYTRGKCNVSHSISMEKANEAVFDALETVIGSNSFVFAPQEPPKAKNTQDWDKLISQEEQRLNRAKTALLDGAFTSAEYKEIKESVEDTIARLEEAKQKDRPAEIDREAYKKKVMDVVSILRSPDVSDEAKNVALRSIVDRIVYNKPNNTFDIYFTP